METCRAARTVVAIACGGMLGVFAGCGGASRTLEPLPPPILGTKAPPGPTLPSEPSGPRPKPLRQIPGAKIVIDAGHGGLDPGALGVGPVPEKRITLAIAREVARRLRERGASVVMVRDSDTFVTLDGRAAVADRQRADLFVSIHADSAKRASATGTTVYVSRRASAQSLAAAQRIVEAFRAGGIETRGVGRANYRVLVAHSRPGVLVECGFLSNAGEARRLSTAAYQARVAEAIADGIAEYVAR